MLPRYYKKLSSYLKSGKVLVIYGARRVGKTTLIQEFLAEYEGKKKLVSGDNIAVQNILASQDFERIFEFCDDLDLLVIDEAQQIKNIGMGLKIIVDHLPHIKVIATGSSSFDLANKIGEPLVGRKKVITLFPLSQLELQECHNQYELKQRLEEYMRFGSYPEVLTIKTIHDKKEYLYDTTESYLYKDILIMNLIKNAEPLQKLVKLLAFNIGNEVSTHELAKQVGVDAKTIKHHLDLLEKNFIIISLQSFSRNLSKELNKKAKYYFCDLGIRNAVIGNFNKMNSRNDIGALWENFCVVERAKRNSYLSYFNNSYFWRTYKQEEVDLIEESDGFLYAYEMKYSEKPKAHRGLKAFHAEYNAKEKKIITPENYLDFVL
jgi:predicted AAA+ superfamily ATPase